MESRFLLNVVVGQGATILQLLTSEDETLLIGGNALLVLNFRLYIVNSVGRFHLKSDGLSSQGLDNYTRFSTMPASVIRIQRTYRFACLHEDGEPSVE